MKRLIKTCPICGKEFEHNRRTYCSEECYIKNRRLQAKSLDEIKRNCVACGKEFEVVGRSKRVTCGSKCLKEYKNQRISEATIRDERKKNHDLIELNRQAREQGLTYGQLQAQRQIEKIRGEW